jgi:hypothetical protein
MIPSPDGISYRMFYSGIANGNTAEDPGRLQERADDTMMVLAGLRHYVAARTSTTNMTSPAP